MNRLNTTKMFDPIMNSQSNLDVIQTRKLLNAGPAASRNNRVPRTKATAIAAEIMKTGL
jgi:hypothetical protein